MRPKGGPSYAWISTPNDSREHTECLEMVPHNVIISPAIGLWYSWLEGNAMTCCEFALWLTFSGPELAIR